MSSRRTRLYGLMTGAAAAIALAWADYRYAERRLWQLRRIPVRRRSG